jgi:dTDP-4-dehydrorhamnose reductase
MRVVIVGANGQLGSDLMRVMDEAIPLTHSEIEVEDRASCERIVELEPDVVVNMAAFHRTEECEDDPERAFSVNAMGALNVARASESAGATCVFISTDYVFGGVSGHYFEEDPVRPLNVYGASKLAGETLTRAYSTKHYILRVSSLFGSAGASGKGGNFVETMIANMGREDGLRVVDDVLMSPTYTLDAAIAIGDILDSGLRGGNYHVVNRGSCSWFDFAKAIFELMGEEVDITPVPSSEYPTRARRPSDSSLSSHKLRSSGIEMREWREALEAYLVERGHIGR